MPLADTPQQNYQHADSMTISKIIWITGASSGLGEALSERWSAPGIQLIISGRNMLQLEIVAEKCKNLGAEVSVLPFDLTNTEELTAAVNVVK